MLLIVIVSMWLSLVVLGFVVFVLLIGVGWAGWWFGVVVFVVWSCAVNRNAEISSSWISVLWVICFPLIVFCVRRYLYFVFACVYAIMFEFGFCAILFCCFRCFTDYFDLRLAGICVCLMVGHVAALSVCFVCIKLWWLGGCYLACWFAHGFLLILTVDGC